MGVQFVPPSVISALVVADPWDRPEGAGPSIDTDDLDLLTRAVGLLLHEPAHVVARARADATWRAGVQTALARVRLAQEHAESALWPERCRWCGGFIDTDQGDDVAYVCGIGGDEPAPGLYHVRRGCRAAAQEHAEMTMSPEPVVIPVPRSRRRLGRRHHG